MAIAEELQKLDDLRRAGTLSEEEFAKAKAAVLAGSTGPVSSVVSPEAQAAAKESETRQWAMFLHLSLLAGVIVPLAGLILPIVLWQVKKQELPGIDAHGKMIVNWIISAVIYALASCVLIILLIGIPLLIAVAIVSIVFPIIGAIKANEGVLWKYPMTITFLS